MSAEFHNVYQDKARADAYAALEFPGTYYLAYPGLPAIIGEHVHGRKAIDFGCGTGRSTRFCMRWVSRSWASNLRAHARTGSGARSPRGVSPRAGR